MDFLAKLYAEEQEKTASAEVDHLVDQMSISQLEQVLGIKTAGTSAASTSKAISKRLAK